MKKLTTTTIWERLEEVKDPEIPAISLVEMGIIRNVVAQENDISITMTPTFSGCPAITTMVKDIKEQLFDLGAKTVDVEISYVPPWTSDWITNQGREKLKKFGLAPPPKHGKKIEILFSCCATCPHCDSEDTTLTNTFGSALCKSMHYCNSCKEPFEQIKPI